MQVPADNLNRIQDVESRAFRCKNGALRFGAHHNRSSEVQVSKCLFHSLVYTLGVLILGNIILSFNSFPTWE